MNCLRREGPHAGAGEGSEEGGAAETACDGLTAAPIPRPPAPLGGRRERTGGEAEPGKRWMTARKFRKVSHVVQAPVRLLQPPRALSRCDSTQGTVCKGRKPPAGLRCPEHSEASHPGCRDPANSTHAWRGWARRLAARRGRAWLWVPCAGPQGSARRRRSTAPEQLCDTEQDQGRRGAEERAAGTGARKGLRAAAVLFSILGTHQNFC